MGGASTGESGREGIPPPAPPWFHGGYLPLFPNDSALSKAETIGVIKVSRYCI